MRGYMTYAARLRDRARTPLAIAAAVTVLASVVPQDGELRAPKRYRNNNPPVEVQRSEAS